MKQVLLAHCYSIEIAWSDALVYDIGLLVEFPSSSRFLVAKLRDTRVRDKLGGARLRWRRRRLRMRVAGKGAERGIFVRIDLAYI